MDDQQLANVLATLALDISERMSQAVDDVAKHGSAAPSAIVVVWQQPGETIDYLRKALSLSHSGTVRLVERLIGDGLLRKKPAVDARAVALTCTTMGAKRARNILVARQKIVYPIIQGFSAGEKRLFEAMLRRISWGGINSKREAIHICRLCDLQKCCRKGNCPVTIARLSNAAGDLERQLLIQQTPYDPVDPDASLVKAQ